ncbi:MAG: YncE family protein [Chloroflexota bacterium]
MRGDRAGRAARAAALVATVLLVLPAPGAGAAVPVTDHQVGGWAPVADAPGTGDPRRPPPPPRHGPPPRAVPSDLLRLHRVHTIRGRISPKSVVGTGDGRFFAMNMMYSHSVTVYDRRFHLLRTISDAIRLSTFRAGASSARVRGAPVEGAVSPDRRFIYVTNYSMYGPGFAHPGWDHCYPGDRIDHSYVYRIDTHTLRITGIYQAGEVPKYLAVSPDGRWLLVANWCSMDLTIIDLAHGRVARTIPAGWNPRGIAFSPDSRRAYIAETGMGDILVLDLRTLSPIRTIQGVGTRPRHLVMSPDGRYLYVTLEGVESSVLHDGAILKLDVETGRVVDRITGLVEPRTTVLAPDGRSLYVVDYFPGTLVKIATGSMRRIQTVHLGYHPIGATYDGPTSTLWVAGYGGEIWILRDRPIR